MSEREHDGPTDSQIEDDMIERQIEAMEEAEIERRIEREQYGPEGDDQ